MTPGHHLTNFCSLPELEIKYIYGGHKGWFEITAYSISKFRVCPKCKNISFSVYDHRWVSVLDSPLRDRRVRLRIRKKRYYCHRCKKPFTELLHGIYAHDRSTDRLRRSILYFSKRFQNLVQVAHHHGCSPSTVHRSLYLHLERDVKRHLNYPWPSKIGIDENRFGRPQGRYYGVDYNTMFVDIKNHRLYRICESKSSARLFEQLKHIEGGELVRDVVIDLSESNRSLSRTLFPNARITADKFHVLRLLVPAINRVRKKVTFEKRKNLIGRLFLRSKKRLSFFQRSMISGFLEPYDELKALYNFKERLHGLYRTKGKRRAEIALKYIIEDLKNHEQYTDLKKLRYTLTRWKTEILNHFESKLTNAMAEGFNNKAKLIRKMGYGYRNRNNYMLRLLNACL